MDGNLPQLIEYKKETLAKTTGEESMDVLLEKQIASCSGVIGQIVDYVARAGLNADVCANFVGRIPSLMTASAAVGRVVSQLRASDRKKPAAASSPA